ncbi:MAG: FAD-binding oxidoreductase [Gammaproteobacteria bacterium]|jgi:FAD/FMN-containing dehydrogenase|nr:FAD-binding oxidoreductase [Gammaproteobacteria bacterium]MBT5205018.1 FAD-binding oxidoreductase [Gammaproteobacteria bacterium]MBT5602183.1 FAD-binding oxidoreductase [Gammaproteobacteria bacterium]MBT6246146.1 FAD-binding oxidoreductase [Gammaproteobacteria bacterium]
MKTQSTAPSHLRPVAKALVKALPEGTVLFDDDVTSRSAGIWRTDTLKARILVKPRTTEEVSTTLRICNELGQSVVTQGGLTGLVESAITQPDDVILSLALMNQIEAVQPLERTMIVQSGCTLQSIQEAAEAQGLMFPLDLGSRGSCTIGGNIATNAGGNRVIRYGMARDMVLGLEAVLADGTVVSSMNLMIKNNAGYDLKHYFIGSEGTLGVITRAVLRCREQVTSSPTFMAGIDTFDQLSRFLKHVDRAFSGNLSAFEVMWNDYYKLVTTPPSLNQAPLPENYNYYVLVEAMGASEEQNQQALEQALEEDLIADAVIAQSETQRLQLWGLRDDVAQVFQFAPVFLFDVSLRISCMQDYVEKVNKTLQSSFPDSKNFTLGHMGDGNLHFAISVGRDDTQARKLVEAAVYEPLKDIAGSVSAEHGVGLEKKPYLHLVRSQSEIRLMKQVKHSLDPNGILNPGKIFD